MGAELQSLLLRVGERFGRVEPRRRMRDYVRGLLGPVGRKNSWQIAEQAGHDTPYGLQRLLSWCQWDPDEVRDDLQDYVAERLGQPDGVLIVDDTGFLKKGTVSAGVQRQYSGTAGRTENCQIGVFAAYASAKGRALVDRELYLPRSWTEDPDRCRAARIPEDKPFATKPELARAMVQRALDSALPIAWVTADAAYGQEWHFRRMLEEAGVGYVLAVPKSQQVKSPAGSWRIDHVLTGAPAEAWERISCGDGAKGPRVYDWAAAKLPAVDGAKRSRLARPKPMRLRSLTRVTWPSTWPELHEVVSAAVTASWSRRRPLTRLCRAGRSSARTRSIQEASSSPRRSRIMSAKSRTCRATASSSGQAARISLSSVAWVSVRCAGFVMIRRTTRPGFGAGRGSGATTGGCLGRGLWGFLNGRK